MVPAMTVTATRLSFFLDVVHFPAGGHFAVSADDAAAGESGEAEKPNETHDALDPFACKESKLCTAEASVPAIDQLSDLSVQRTLLCIICVLTIGESRHRIG
jgi:hypothetical protein